MAVMKFKKDATASEKAEAISAKIRELQNERRRITRAEQKREALEREKKRTHRLCKIGGLIEKYAEREITDFDAFEEWIKSADFIRG